MATRIRMQRHGRRGYPFYSIVIADRRVSRDGKFIEKIGSYNPNTNPATIDLNFEVLLKQYRERKNHKLDEWHTYCDWIKEITLLNEIIKKYGY